MLSAQQAVCIGAAGTAFLTGIWLGLLFSKESNLGSAQSVVVESQAMPVGAPTGSSGSETTAVSIWEVVARFDAKIANVLIIITIALTLLPILIAIFERGKAKDLEDIRNRIATEQHDFRERIDDTIETQVDRKIEQIRKRFAAEMVRDVHGTAIEETEKRLSFLHREDASAERVLLSFLNSDLVASPDGALLAREYIKVFELQRALSDLKGADRDLIHAALVHIGAQVDQLSEVTALHLRHHLKLIEVDGKIRSIANRGIWLAILRRIDEKWSFVQKDS